VGDKSFIYEQKSQVGYRVQVFSSNAQRTAKTEAFKVEKQIKDGFPEYAVYVNYTSPFWKVRVGDFKTMEDAQAFRNELNSTFPQLRSETYIVREQIHVSSLKQN
jgi:septal ring-binding cell division protein DamX